MGGGYGVSPGSEGRGTGSEGRGNVSKAHSGAGAPKGRNLRALIVGDANARGSLAAVRALAGAGWTVDVGSPQPGLSSHSRWCSGWHFVPSPEKSPGAFTDAVNRAGNNHGYRLVFGGGDAEVLALSAARATLSIPVPYASHDRVLRALDKEDLRGAARRAGLLSPQTVEVGDLSPATLEKTVVVKPNLHWTPEGAPRFKVIVTNDRDTVRRRAREIHDAGLTPLIQEYMPGRLLAFVALTDKNGDIVTGFSQITDRLWPLGAGMFARATTIPTDDQLWQGAAALLKEIGWFGIAQLQFQCTDEGERYLIDLNGRFYWSLALPVKAGVNLPAMWASLALEQGIEIPASLPTSARYQWLRGDIQRALKERRGGLLRDLSETFRFAGSATHGLWDKEDVGPSLHFLSELPGHLAERTLSRLTKQWSAPALAPGDPQPEAQDEAMQPRGADSGRAEAV